jgi:hypothetical protein
MRIEIAQAGPAKGEQKHCGELLEIQRRDGLDRRVRARHAKERDTRMHRRIKGARIHRQPIPQNRRGDFHMFRFAQRRRERSEEKKAPARLRIITSPPAQDSACSGVSVTGPALIMGEFRFSVSVFRVFRG